MTMQTLAITTVLLEDPGDWLYGLEISRRTKLRSGTIYPALMRLERAGWVESEWEAIDPADEGRPRRRNYRLTGFGETNARAAVREQLEQLQRVPLKAGFAPGALGGTA